MQKTIERKLTPKNLERNQRKPKFVPLMDIMVFVSYITLSYYCYTYFWEFLRPYRYIDPENFWLYYKPFTFIYYSKITCKKQTHIVEVIESRNGGVYKWDEQVSRHPDKSTLTNTDSKNVWLKGNRNTQKILYEKSTI